MAIHIGKMIKSIIEEKGLSYVQVGKGIDKSNKTVPGYLEKKTLSIDLLIAFSQTLGADLLRLYYTEEPMRSRFYIA